MDFTNIFRLVNLAVAAVMILGAIFQFFSQNTSIIHKVVIGTYVVLFGSAVGVLELVPQVPPYLPKYASFLFSFLGRGIFYILVGTLLMDGNYKCWIPGLLIDIVGVGYCALEFAPQIEPPSNMRDGEAGWGAEQV